MPAMTKRQYLFYLTLPHYSSAGEKQFICFTAAAFWQKEHFICITPGLDCSEQQNAKSNPCCCFFRQRSTRRSEPSLIFKRVLFGGSLELVVNAARIIYPGKHGTWHAWQQHFILHTTPHKSLSPLFLSSEMLLRCIYCICLCVTGVMDANYRLGFQPDNGSTTGLLVEQ